MRRGVLLFLPLLGLGCAREDTLMPLEAGTEVTYVVRTPLNSRVEPLRVIRRMPVAGVEGAELRGPLGTSRLAWRDGVLWADSTVNGRFFPSLPLVAEDGKPRDWNGRIETLGRSQPASGVLVHAKETLRLGTRRVATTRSTLTLELPKSGARIEVISWFQPGIGLVQQEQRTNGRRVVQLQLLSGP